MTSYDFRRWLKCSFVLMYTLLWLVTRDDRRTNCCQPVPRDVKNVHESVHMHRCGEERWGEFRWCIDARGGGRAKLEALLSSKTNVFTADSAAFLLKAFYYSFFATAISCVREEFVVYLENKSTNMRSRDDSNMSISSRLNSTLSTDLTLSTIFSGSFDVSVILRTTLQENSSCR